jgi:hypothetical protein
MPCDGTGQRVTQTVNVLAKRYIYGYTYFATCLHQKHKTGNSEHQL